FLIIITIFLFFSSLLQGSIDFGYPLMSTPLLAMNTDMKTAILYVAIPTHLINLIAIFSEGNILSAIKRFYPLALFAMIG
ncbi:sulfite exporter TauE/SafE family protein, partial [Aliarcobacter butzleri]